MIAKFAAVGALIVSVSLAPARAESGQSWRLHTTLEGDARPFLCKDRETVDLVGAVLRRALEARAESDSEKSKRLLEIAAKLESEICVRPIAEDIVILRCNLDQKNFGGSSVSIVKMSALLRSNTSAGEQPYYGWTYAAIEPTSAAQDADQRWCADEEQVADAPLEPTPDLVQRVQQRFYDFGFYMPDINGQLSPETVQGLIDFQKWAGLPPNGQLTKLTVHKIDSTSAPSPWVAVAFDGFGNNSMMQGNTRRIAETDAANGLQRKSRTKDYKVVAVSYPNCIALATTRYKTRKARYGQAFVGVGTSAAAAGDSALQFCNSQKSGGTCKVSNTLCPAGADTSPPRYDRGSIPVNASRPPRYDPTEIPANAANPAFSGGEQRFDPADMPINAPLNPSDEAPGTPPQPPEPDVPPAQVSSPEPPSSSGEAKAPNP
jgi:hypothetical protein